MYPDPHLVSPQTTYLRQRLPVGLSSEPAKRLMDVLLVLLAAPLVLPLVLFLALMLRLSGQTAFFAHWRVGRDGVMFRCWKLQTMVADADRLLAEHLSRNPAAAREWIQHRKLSDDPRITRLGRFLRKTSLDELPQLLNVLKGEMSLVGPRPITAQELRGYGVNAKFYMSATPGITGLWQIRGRNALAMDERIACDVEYARGRTFLQDSYILFRTVPAVLSGGQ